MNEKLWFLCFKGIQNSLPSFWAKLGYSQIKIDHIVDSLLKLQIRIGVHLISDELSQLPTLDVPKSFNIYITPRHEWHGIVNGLWPGKYPPLKIETSSYSLPLDVNVHLSSNYFEPYFEQKCIIIKCVFWIIVWWCLLFQIPIE